MTELTLNEKRLLSALGECKSADARNLAHTMGVSEEAVVQYVHLLHDRGLAEVRREVEHTYALTEEGMAYMRDGLPERQVFNSFSDEIEIKRLKQHPLAKIAIGWMRKKGWVAIREGTVVKSENVPEGDDERALRHPEKGGTGIQELIKRNLAEEKEVIRYTVIITPAGAALANAGLDMREEAGTLTREQIISGEWENLNLRKYSVDKIPKRIYPGKLHPYQRLIDEMRQIFLEMGFTEIYGGLVQSSFWNFDALFQPQDHPAREMQDTFYLVECAALPPGFERVRDMHEHGGGTSSTGWGGSWSKAKAEQCVLRTHTTSLSIQHLAAHPEPPVKAFCISRVYRREAIDPTHLPEFEQLEGIVMDKGVGFRHLLGYLKEFYGRMGFEDVRFRPAYFPYTEPSVEPEVFIDGLGWVEMGGAGVFREEVTAPWRIKHPVLAWGLGVSRLAMFRMGLKDLRFLYRSDIELIRDTPIILPETIQGRRT
jgi:phenylalanyl-tRNA synthetase alpha chain